MGSGEKEAQSVCLVRIPKSVSPYLGMKTGLRDKREIPVFEKCLYNNSAQNAKPSRPKTRLSRLLCFAEAGVGHAEYLLAMLSCPCFFTVPDTTTYQRSYSED